MNKRKRTTAPQGLQCGQRVVRMDYPQGNVGVIMGIDYNPDGTVCHVKWPVLGVTEHKAEALILAPVGR